MRAFLLATFTAVAFISQARCAELRGRVVKIADGDTITVLVDAQQEKVRLVAIDCPENKQPFSAKAKQHTSDLCFGQDVKVAWEKRDQWGRILGEVMVDGKSVNRALLKDGMAWHFKRYSKDTELQKLEDEARAAKRGLWADKEPIPPWDWRKQEKERRKAKTTRRAA